MAPSAKIGGEGHQNPPDREPFLPTRVTLLSRLRDWDDRASWQEFFDTYWKLLYGTAKKAGLPDADAEEVVQDVIVAASKALPKFQYDPELGSFKGWLMRITQRRIADAYRKRPPWANQEPAGESDETGGPRTATVERLPDPKGEVLEQFWDAEWTRNLVDTAIERIKNQVSERQFQIFDLVVNTEWPTRDVCQTLQISIGQLYVAKHRVAKLVRKEIARLEEKSAKGTGIHG